MNDAMPLDEKRAQMAEETLDKTLLVIRHKSEDYRIQAERQRRIYGRAKTAAIILGVLTPTVVALQTQDFLGQYAIFWSMFAIVITAGTGIVTGLQAAFRWGEGYARSATASLELNDLAESIGLESLLYRTTPDYGLKYNELRRLHDNASRQLQSIVRRHTQAEIADVTEETSTRSIPESSTPELSSSITKDGIP